MIASQPSHSWFSGSRSAWVLPLFFCPLAASLGDNSGITLIAHAQANCQETWRLPWLRNLSEQAPQKSDYLAADQPGKAAATLD